MEEEEDKMAWIPLKCNIFKSRAIPMLFIWEWKKHFQWQSIPKHMSTIKRGFFLLVCWIGKILTADDLKERGLIIMDYCYMCKSHEESMSHLFLHCDIAQDLCSLVFSSFVYFPCIKVTQLFVFFLMKLLQYNENLEHKNLVGIAFIFSILVPCLCLWNISMYLHEHGKRQTQREGVVGRGRVHIIHELHHYFLFLFYAKRTHAYSGSWTHL